MNVSDAQQPSGDEKRVVSPFDSLIARSAQRAGSTTSRTLSAMSEAAAAEASEGERTQVYNVPKHLFPGPAAVAEVTRLKSALELRLERAQRAETAKDAELDLLRAELAHAGARLEKEVQRLRNAEQKVESIQDALDGLLRKLGQVEVSREAVHSERMALESLKSSYRTGDARPENVRKGWFQSHG